ncbi:MAG: phage major capsid protein, partial [Bacteroidales bacterium]|nr:phage major capsid protein [Bacteroidales bacterium]
TVLGQAIGYALDKAILFGLGTRMPQGFFTRLAQTSAPADYPATARTWVDLHTTNIASIATTVTGVDIFRQFVIKAAAAKGKYSRGEKVWVMNELTYAKLMAAAMANDAFGQIVAGMEARMPVVGGIIEVLPFIPDNMVFGGYLDLYLLAEREGTELTQSEHVHFLADKTVFKGVARYDGLPVIAEGFVAIGLDGTTPSATGISFAPDTANTGA